MSQLADPRRHWIGVGLWSLAISILLLIAYFYNDMNNPFRYLKSQGTRYPNPPVVIHETAEEARQSAADEAKAKGGKIYRTSGTPSMEPLITGSVIVVNVPKPYDQLQEGEIANYGATWTNGAPVLHRLVQRDKDGWIGSGDNNHNSEAQSRVTKDNYLDVLATIHTYKGAEKTRVTADCPPEEPAVQAVLTALKRKQANAK